MAGTDKRVTASTSSRYRHRLNDGMSLTDGNSVARSRPSQTGGTHCCQRGRTEFDNLLVAVGVRRDSEAFTALFDHFGPRVRAQMLRGGDTAAAAEDLAQDVMETIWHKAHLYDPNQSAAVTWIFQIARNRRVDIRRRSREYCCVVDDFFDIPDPAEANDERLDAAQRRKHVRAALGALPREQVAIVHLAFFEGLSHSAIARKLNMPLGTVKSRLRLACTRLRRLLADAGLTEATVAS
jgi:RNA polymerase sigma-70 factor, ECF subfamily